MKVYIYYNKKLSNYNVKLDKYLFLNFFLWKEKILIWKKISLKTYNYMLIIKLLRSFGLVKPLLNIKEYK